MGRNNWKFFEDQKKDQKMTQAWLVVAWLAGLADR